LRDNGQVNGHDTKLALARPRPPRRWPPRVVALTRSADRPATLTGRQAALDIALAAAATVISLAIVMVAARSPAGPASPLLHAAPRGIGWRAALPAVALRTAPLALRRFRPLTAFWLTLAACVLAPLTQPTVVDLVALAPAAYSAAAHSRHQAAALLSLPAAVVVLAWPGVAPAQSGNYALLITLLVLIAAVAGGRAARRLRRRAGDSRSRLLRLEAEHQDATRQAIGHERARIASELHDVVTHNVSMMVVQAGAARRVLSTSPQEARSALLAIEESGRAAIVELQHLLGLLTPPGELEDGSLTGTQDAEPLAPQPGLDRVQPLIERVAAAGVPVALQVRGTPRALPPGLDLAAYRVVQEALTNVLKHAGQPRTTVTLDYRCGALLIEIADDGPPDEAAAAASLRGAPGCPGTIPGTGRGLLGLRERVSLYGGKLDAGRQPGGGWLVRAWIPEEPAPAAAAAFCPAVS
jgi:signal transduction histidine kinase